MDLVEFVRTTEIIHKPLHPRLLAASSNEDNQKQADVVAGAILAFTEKLSGQVKQDILNAMLFAQLAANKKFSREDKPDEWYKFYVDVLGHIGFVIQKFDFTKYKSKGQTFKMDKVVLEILEAGMTGSETEVAKAAIDALGKLPGDDRSVTLFDNQSTSLNKGNFQIGQCDQAANGDVVIGLGAFHFTVDKHETRFLWWSWSSSQITLYQGFQAMVMNTELYGKARDAIADKLGIQEKIFVAGIDI